MAEFAQGQKVLVPNPDGEGEVEATFVGPGEPDEAVEVPLEGGTRKADVARVRYEDGTLGLVVHAKVRAGPESSVTIAGGTPEHRWLEVYAAADLEPLLVGPEQQPLKIIAANDEEASRALDGLAKSFGVPREALTIKPPPGWAGYGSPPQD